MRTYHLHDHHSSLGFYTYAVNGRTEVVRALLDHGGSDVDARWGSWGLTALHQGRLVGTKHEQKRISTGPNGARPNPARPSVHNTTHTSAACFYHREDIVRLLLQHHADPRVADKKGRRPLHVAKEEAQPRIAAMLEVRRRGASGHKSNE